MRRLGAVGVLAARAAAVGDAEFCGAFCRIGAVGVLAAHAAAVRLAEWLRVLVSSICHLLATWYSNEHRAPPP